MEKQRKIISRVSIIRRTWIVLLGFLLLGSFLYALIPSIRALLPVEPELGQVRAAKLGHDLELRQRMENVSVTLDWVYADENAITIAFTIEAPNGKTYEPNGFTLIDNAGVSFPLIAGMDSDEVNSSSETSVSPYRSEYVFSFDASSLSNQLPMLNLNLDLMLESSSESENIGPFTFSFNLPFTPGRTAKISTQTVAAAGIPVTLEEVVITPSDMTAIICFSEPQEGYADWLPISHINVQEGESTAEARVGSQASTGETGCTNNRYFPTLYEHSSGLWTLTVSELVGFKENGPEQQRISGPWTFEFEIP